MVRGEAIPFEELDRYKVGMAYPRSGAIAVMTVENDRLDTVALFSGEAEADISASALAEHLGQTIIVKTDKRATRYAR